MISWLSDVWKEKWLRWSVWWLVICVVVVGIYSNTFYNQFVFDDYLLIGDVGKRAYGVDDWDKFVDLMSWKKQRMVGFFSFAINYHLHEFDVFGYHVVNTLIHAINGLLVWWMGQLVMKTPRLARSVPEKNRDWVAGWMALVFVAHPVQTESVTYVIQRFASLGTTFYLGAVITYLLGKFNLGWKRYGWWVVVLGLGIVGIYTKEIAASIPIMLLMIEGVCFGSWRKKVSWKAMGLIVPILVTSGLLLWGNRHYAFHVKESALGERIGVLEYALTQPRVVVRYVGLLALPTSLNVDYYFPISKHAGELRMWAAVTGIIGLGVVAMMSYRRMPLVSMGLVWWLVALLVESTLIPLEDVIAEHRLYLPMVGFAMVVVGFGVYLRDWAIKNRKWSVQKAGWVVTAGLMGLVSWYGVLTYQRNFVWRDDLSLWQDTVKKSPLKARVRLNLGTAYQSRGNLKAAQEQYEQAIKLGPPMASVYNNLAVLAAQKDELEKAVEYFEKAMRLDPKIESVGDNFEKVKRRIKEKQAK